MVTGLVMFSLTTVGCTKQTTYECKSVNKGKEDEVERKERTLQGTFWSMPVTRSCGKCVTPTARYL